MPDVALHPVNRPAFLQSLDGELVPQVVHPGAKVDFLGVVPEQVRSGPVETLVGLVPEDIGRPVKTAA